MKTRIPFFILASVFLMSHLCFAGTYYSSSEISIIKKCQTDEVGKSHLVNKIEFRLRESTIAIVDFENQNEASLNCGDVYTRAKVKLNAALLGNGQLSWADTSTQTQNELLNLSRIVVEPQHLKAYCPDSVDSIALHNRKFEGNKALVIRVDHPSLSTDQERVIYISPYYSWYQFGRRSCESTMTELNELFSSAENLRQNIAITYDHRPETDFTMTSDNLTGPDLHTWSKGNVGR